jgi:hypothetical protein
MEAPSKMSYSMLELKQESAGSVGNGQQGSIASVMADLETAKEDPMEIVLLVLILTLGIAVLLESTRGDQLQRQNNYLREENQSLRIQTMSGNNDSGVGCGSVLGFLVGLGAILVIFYMLGVFPG